MTIYEVLERLVIGPVFRSDEEETAVRVIRQCRDMNVLGTMARFIDPATHDCRAGDYWPDSGQCVICGVPITVKVHECSPVTRWAGNRWDLHGTHTTNCRICNREM